MWVYFLVGPTVAVAIAVGIVVSAVRERRD